MSALKSHSRYPYTFACDFLRGKVDDFNVDFGMRVPTISRSQASQAIGAIADVLGVTKQELAEKLADRWIADVELTAPPKEAA
ncbi:hypothetical protein [Variovorax sp. N23]|uniref:hypothetical protein n=1 Tax=Variovorax sp. N23 TaxID=2980555 RepID=UPI0021CA3617|nr:hypothetical protein [Variovorax sp. N23]MCU4119346.1 hypothetical protein [Variovorax sp. N23]